MKKSKVFIALSATLILGACATETPVRPVEQTQVKREQPAPITTPVVQEAPKIKEVEPAKKPELPPSVREVRFGYDSSELNAQAQDVIGQHASYLLNHPEQKMLIEGHADERGGDQYNFVLGEERANAIRQALLAKGVAAEQLQTKSFGEKQPKVAGQGEAIWQQNRRAALDYVNSQPAVAQSDDTKLNGSPMVVSDH